MTDKVIINGVEVSKCEFYNVEDSECSIDDKYDFIGFTVCQDYSNCYYKQLARKTQECEKLKEENEQAEVWFKKACKYKFALEEIEGLAKSINDEFENDDIEQQLHYAQDISKQIQEIIDKAKDE